MDIINQIGENGPNTVFLLCFYLLYFKPILLITFIIGYQISFVLNHCLKGYLRFPRPNENLKLFYIKINSDAHIPFERFGLPSGHAQAIFFSLSFLFFSLQKKINLNSFLFFFILIIATITLFQRYYWNHHTILQLLCGAILGAIVGYLFYYYSQIRLRGSSNWKIE
jgi:membrane-associated phospholipid phosphatase